MGIDAGKFDTGKKAPPTEPSVPVRTGRVLFRRAADRLPTKWFGAIGAGVFLLLTAAFGGLGAAPPSLPEVAIGEAYNNDQVSITVEQLLVAEAVDRGSTANPGEKIVVVVVTAVNRWDRPQTVSQAVVRNLSVSEQPEPDTTATNAGPPTPKTSAAAAGGVEGTVAAAADGVLDGADAPSVVRLDDLAQANELQPGVPVRLAVIWAVDADFARRLAGSDGLVVTLYDQELIVSEYVSTKDGWNFPTAAATVIVTPTVRGSVALSELGGMPTVETSAGSLDAGSTPATSSGQER